jgi:hypothetical protein
MAPFAAICGEIQRCALIYGEVAASGGGNTAR